MVAHEAEAGGSPTCELQRETLSGKKKKKRNREEERDKDNSCLSSQSKVPTAKPHHLISSSRTHTVGGK